MTRICRPNLPEGRVTEVLVGEAFFKMLAGGFYSYGLKPLIVKGPALLPGGIRDHPDICLRHVATRSGQAGGTLLTFSNAIIPRYTLERGGFVIKSVPGPQSAAYPCDAALNAAIIGNIAVYSPGVMSPALKAELTKNGYRLLPVKQGYSACSTAVVDDYSAITSDSGIAKALLSEGIDVLLITPGYIALEGYDYGFIGGACGKLSKNTLVFTGKLDGHPDREKILNFLIKKQIFPIFLTDLPVFDAGGIVPLREESNK